MNTLKHYAIVQPGYPFRGSIPEVADGAALTIQMRDVSMVDGAAWNGVARTNLAGRKEPNWLRVDDILFLARGANNFAVHLDQVPGLAVCSQSFFLLRVTHGALLSAFLAWQINQLSAQTYFRKHAEGSVQVSIRRAILESLPIAAPPLEQQHHLLCYAAEMQQERLHLEQLIRNRERQMQHVATQVLSGNASGAATSPPPNHGKPS
jgi:hypothetical protein